MRVSEIYIYPVKSLKGISLNGAKIENQGFQFDRRWMLIDENNEFITQRRFPAMARIEVDIKNSELIFSYDGENASAPVVSETNETSLVQIWSDKCRAKVYGENINQWFSKILKTDCRLVAMSKETNRKVNYFNAVSKSDTVSFADACPYLLIGESSLEDLNLKLEKTIPMNRFRPNIVFDGGAPFAEDDWKKIRIGETIFHLVKPCARCVMTTIDQAKGVLNGVEPLKTLAGYRIPKRSVKKKILFGQYMIAEKAGETVKVGDEVEVVEYKT